MFDRLALAELEALKNKMHSGFMKINPADNVSGPMFWDLYLLQSEVDHAHFTRFIKQ